MSNKLEKATLGGGCFWCLEAVYQDVQGVLAVESGYAGGHVPNPTYREVCGKQTGHAEVVQITYDPDLVTFEELLSIFWSIHDPTTPNQQGNDRGPQYRSIILYHDEVQKSIAEKSKLEVATELWSNPIVTEIEPLAAYYSAEKYHQNYYNDNSYQPYCVAVINPKLKKFREKFSHKLKPIQA